MDGFSSEASVTPEDLRSLALALNPANDPVLPDSCVQPHHERCFQPGLNHASRIGRTTYLVQKFGWPPYIDWVSRYFDEGETRPPTADPAQVGRTPAELLDLIVQLRYDLLRHARGQCDYSEEKVADWFLHLVFARTWWGSRGERAVWDRFGGPQAGWRTGTYDEDVRQGLDLVNDHRMVAVQVKRDGWHAKDHLRTRWLKQICRFAGDVFLVEYKRGTNDVAGVFRAVPGGVTTATWQDVAGE